MNKSKLPPPAELLALLQARASFVIATHLGPDGDALGGSLALFHALRAQGRQVQVVAPTPPARHYRWLPGATDIAQAVEGEPEVAVVIDCDSFTRLEKLQPAIQAVPALANIDHHSGEPFGQIRYVDSTASAAALLVLRVLRALRWPLTSDLATCLYTGLATDTGFFRFQNTDEETLRSAADLVAAGADPFTIAQLVSERRPANRMQLAGRALASLQSAAEGRLVYGVLRPQDYQETGTGAADTEGIIDSFKQVEGQEVCVLFKAPRDETAWQVSLRSETVDVAAVARAYQGGGHARAAGFDYRGELPAIQQDLRERLRAALESLP